MGDIEEKLIKDKWISPLNLIEAQNYPQTKTKSLFCSLIKLGYLTEEDVFRFFALNSNIPFVKVSHYHLKEEVVILLDEDFCRENLVIPLFKINTSLFVAMVNPLDAQIISNINRCTRLDVYPLLASPGDIEVALNNYWGYPKNFFDMEKFLFTQKKLSNFPLYRAKKRLPLNVSVSLKIDDENVKLTSEGFFSANTFDAAEDISALGIKTSIFLPKGTKLVICFSGTESKIRGEVIYCRMESRDYFSVGITLLDLRQEDSDYIRRFLKPLTESG